MSRYTTICPPRSRRALRLSGAVTAIALVLGMFTVGVAVADSGSGQAVARPVKKLSREALAVASKPGGRASREALALAGRPGGRASREALALSSRPGGRASREALALSSRPGGRASREAVVDSGN